MNRRATLFTGCLTAGVAFTAAFLLARSPGYRSEAAAGSSSAVPDRIAPSTMATDDSPSPETGPDGVLHDALLTKALANVNLIEAVKEIMAHEQEDHCADTRLICLIESLPAARLSELHAVLDANLANDYIVRFVLGTWAQRDPAGAKAWVDAHPALNENGSSAFMRGWVRSSPEAALAWLDAQPVSASSGDRREAVVEAISERNPAAAFELMKSRGWLAQDPRSLHKLLHNWGASDPRAAVAGLRGIAAELGLRIPEDPQSKLVGPSGPNASFRSLLSAVLNGAFDRNPADAAALLREFSADELAAGREAIAREVLSRDPGAASALFGNLTDPNARAMILTVAETSPGMALEQLTSIKDLDFQRDLLVKAVAGLNERPDIRPLTESARDTVAGLLASITDATVRSRTAGALVVSNAAAAPEWSAKLWTTLTPGQQRKDGPAFFRETARTDAALALQTYSASTPEVQDASLRGLCAGLASTKPERALELVLQRAPALRAETAATLFAYWSASAPDAAMAALEASSGHLDLRAMEEKLADAGQFYGGNATRFESVSTDALRARIQQLLGK